MSLLRVHHAQYPATVEAIDVDAGTCTVRFAEGHRQFQTPLWELRPPPAAAAAPTSGVPTHQPLPPAHERPQTAPAPPQAAFAPALAGKVVHPVAAISKLNFAPLGSDTLANMIMAWYQSGFYTGYYMAQQMQPRS